MPDRNFREMSDRNFREIGISARLDDGIDFVLQVWLTRARGGKQGGGRARPDRRSHSLCPGRRGAAPNRNDETGNLCARHFAPLTRAASPEIRRRAIHPLAGHFR